MPIYICILGGKHRKEDVDHPHPHNLNLWPFIANESPWDSLSKREVTVELCDVFIQVLPKK